MLFLYLWMYVVYSAAGAVYIHAPPLGGACPEGSERSKRHTYACTYKHMLQIDPLER